jgi:hypothetical protein
MSIQEYVFASNKLKENLGASYIVSQIYEPLREIKNIEIGFIGGGNALIFFQNKQIAKESLELFSTQLLVNSPGIKLAAVIDDQFDENSFRKSLDSLFLQLQQMKNKFIPNTILPAHGFTSDCPRTGNSCETYDERNKEFISSVVYTKILSSEYSKKQFELKYLSSFTGAGFPDSFEDLGQDKNSDNKIAVVHIDGNSMGSRFKAINGLDEIRSLSASIEQAVINSFHGLIKTILDDLSKGNYPESITSKYLQNKTLPIIPIIIGGDDITFVCEGRLGLYFAKVFMEFFQIQEASDHKPLSSCAGVAIVKTKYPFYQAYRLAESLCKNAKRKRIEEKNNSSWIDYHLSYGGILGDIKDIRKKHFENDGKALYMRPYSIEQFNELIDCSMKLAETAHSKIKELREVLSKGDDVITNLVKHFSFRGDILPSFLGKDYSVSQSPLFINNETPYLDMIELTEMIFSKNIKENQ